MVDVHFVRPWLLLLLIVFGLLYWLVRKNLSSKGQAQSIIAPHLVAALTPKQRLRDKLKPIDWLFTFCVLLIVAAAGPAWRHVDSADANKPPIAVVLKVTPSMMANDFPPTRLARAKQKVRDLLEYRTGAKTALIAYGATSHKVLPMTADNRVFLPFIEALSPQVMPGGSGDGVTEAIAKARQELEKAGGGAIVLLADGIAHPQVAPLNKAGTPFIWWQFATAKGGIIVADSGNILSDDSGAAQRFALDGASGAQLQYVDVQKVTLNSQDLVDIDRVASDSYRQWRGGDNTAPYRDMSWYFTWPLLVLAALWFRRGFISVDTPRTPRTSGPQVFLLAGLLGATSYSPSAKAEVADWFLSRDQQGLIAYNNKHYERAAALFDDPMWRGTALYKHGDYTQAAQVFATVGTVEGLYNRANALFKAHEYPAAVAGYQQVLVQRPDYPQAARNLALAQAALQKMLAQGGNVDLEQSITMEVDDKRVAQSSDGDSQDYQVTDTLGEDAKEQWMRSVESDMSDFLTAKFATEAASPSAGRDGGSGPGAGQSRERGNQ